MLTPPPTANSKTEGLMSFTSRMASVMISLVLVILVTAQSGAAPEFSPWTVPKNLGPTINSSSIDFGPVISKDGLSLYLASNRPGGFGGQDIWVSQRPTEDAPWGPPTNLGGVVNTPDDEAVPALSRDGHFLFFNSNR